MMHTWIRYLWKEWRDHRSVVLGLLLVWPVLLGLAVLTVPPHALEEAWFADLSGLSLLAIFVFAACTDLFPGEQRRGTLRFLSRMPSGLRAPLAAKFAFFALGCGVLFGWGWWGGALAMHWFGSGVPAFDYGPFVPWALTFLAWTFAVSCGLPRGVLALPATVVFLALLFAPLVAVMWHFRDVNLSRHVEGIDPNWWTAAAVVAVYIGFVRGRRFGRGVARAAVGVGCVALLAAAPLYAALGRDALALHGVAGGGELVLHHAVIGSDTRYAFVSTARSSRFITAHGQPAYFDHGAAILDLHSGEFRRLESGNWFVSPDGPPLARLQPFVTIQTPGRRSFDASTLAPMRVNDPDVLAKSRRVNAWRTSDGGRVWMEGHELVFEDGARYLVRRRPALVRGPCLNLAPRMYFDLDHRKLYDFRGRRVARRAEEGSIPARLWPRRGRWIGWIKNDGYEWFDPESGKREPLTMIHENESIRLVLFDGRVFVHGANEPYWNVTLVDPETGHRTPFHARTFDEAWTPGFRLASAFAPDGSQLLRRLTPKRSSWVLMAPGATEYRVLWDEPNVPAQDRARFLGFQDDGTAWFLVQEREIWTAKEGGTKTKIWPRTP